MLLAQQTHNHAVARLTTSGAAEWLRCSVAGSKGSSELESWAEDPLKSCLANSLSVRPVWDADDEIIRSDEDHPCGRVQTACQVDRSRRAFRGGDAQTWEEIGVLTVQKERQGLSVSFRGR